MRFLRSFAWRLLAMLVIAAFYALLRQGFGLRLTPWRFARPGDACLIPGMRTLGKPGETWTELVCRGGRWSLPLAPIRP